MAGIADQTGAFRVNSLKDLDVVDPKDGAVRWDAARSIWNMLFLAGALTLGPLTFSFDALAIFILTCAITLCAGHSVGFHRRLIHRNFECPQLLDHILIYFGTLVGMGGPLWTIRLHDTRDWAQRQPDCHWFMRHGQPLFL